MKRLLCFLVFVAVFSIAAYAINNRYDDKRIRFRKDWVEFSEESFRADLGKKAMIVEFTADWCPTCKVLERTTLAAPNLLPILDQYSVTAVKVDMTFKNDAHAGRIRLLPGWKNTGKSFAVRNI